MFAFSGISRYNCNESLPVRAFQQILKVNQNLWCQAQRYLAFFFFIECTCTHAMGGGAEGERERISSRFHCIAGA